ncbi:hypothetical protein TNCT_632251 [Trichonephila clavata]|uniref:Uncharacterized protein n=1 Tax=Trichonephila clavata TaxID=2740835 RepID=A0A8X6H2C8_TRICU|nr:hypothetical protein TNCT_632251 [Trichonephila clavata]
MISLLNRKGNELPSASSSELQASEVHSLFKGKIKTIWRSPPEHARYAAKCPELSRNAPVLDFLRPPYLDLGLVTSRA